MGASTRRRNARRRYAFNAIHEFGQKTLTCLRHSFHSFVKFTSQATRKGGSNLRNTPLYDDHDATARPNFSVERVDGRVVLYKFATQKRVAAQGLWRSTRADAPYTKHAFRGVPSRPTGRHGMEGPRSPRKRDRTRKSRLMRRILI